MESGLGRLLNRLRVVKRAMLAQRKNAVFIWIPKTAGTSMFDLLGRYGATKAVEVDQIRSNWPRQTGLVTFGHMSYRQLVDQGVVSGEFDRDAFKFAVCRNPYDRAISLFSYLKHHGVVPIELDFSGFLRSLHDDGCPPLGLYNVLGWSQCNPQVEWIRDINVDKVVRFETMDRDLEEVLAILGIGRRTVRHLNAVERSEAASNYLTPENIRLIDDIYAVDFSEFGYQRLAV